MDKKKILIIDDEIDLCFLLKDYFTRKNNNVLIVSTLKEANLVFTKIMPDIVFLDNNLPDGIGWNYAVKIANDFPDIFIVFISAFQLEIPQMPLNSKYIVLEKPVSFSHLDEQLNKLKMHSA